MTKGSRLSRLGVLAPAALSACIDASVLAAPAAGAILSTILKELSKAFMLKKWFHGVMTAEEAEQLLMKKGKNGSYLVRESQTHPQEYVLSVRVRGRVSHVMIRRENNKYNVGSGEVFDDLTSLIEHCRAYPLIETSGDVLRLMQPINGRSVPSPPLDIAQGGGNPNPPPPRRRPDYEEEKDDSEDQDSGNTPITRYRVAKWNRMPTRSERIEVEFNALRCVDRYTPYTKNDAITENNFNKNRYRNVLPYDQTRVILPDDPSKPASEFNDYINASYIRPIVSVEQENDALDLPTSEVELMDYAGAVPLRTDGQLDGMTQMFDSLSLENHNRNSNSQVKKVYIAAQGCMWTTIHHFWVMIVEKKISVIAMMTKIEENGKRKCEKYWPKNGSTLYYRGIKVTTVHKYKNDYYTLRNFKVVPQANAESFNVYQFQFRAWPDHGVPSETEGILNYINDINYQVHLESLKPSAPKEIILLVHCSAGIGRTGTFIALDMLITQLKTEGIDTHINIQSTVKLCRYQRAGMVQNIRQYKFLHRAVDDYIKIIKKTTSQHKKSRKRSHP